MQTRVWNRLGWILRPFTALRGGALAHERRRLMILLAITLCKLFNLFGSVWDIQWHVTIGRDRLFIPPHVVAALGFVGGLALSLGAITYETWLDRQGHTAGGTVRWGGISAAPAILGVALGYLAATFFSFLDDQWHRAFGLDATLWSPPHLGIMLAMNSIDFSLLLGLRASMRRLGWTLDWHRPAFWGIVLAGAFTFEAANFQLSQAFIEGYWRGGGGLWGLLFPVMMGAWFALALVALVRLSGRFWIVLPVLALTLVLQYVGTGLAALGFAVLQPESVMEAFVRANPTAKLSLAREFAQRNGFTSLIGLQQAWVMWLSALPLALVALLDRWPALRQKPWVAAPVYAGSLVLTSFALFQRLPVMAAYDINLGHLALATGLAVAGSLVMARVGMWVGGLWEKW